jgi:putative cell wall-binding protein
MRAGRSTSRTIVAVVVTTIALLLPVARVSAATPPAVVTFVSSADDENVLTWNEHATLQRTYRWTAVAAIETIGTVTTSCGTAGTRVTNLQAGIGTTAASGSFTCIFDDGPAVTTVSVVAQNGPGDAFHTSTATLAVVIANVAPATTIHGDTPSTVAYGATFTVTLTTATDDSATDAGTGMTYAIKCSASAAFSAFAAARTGTCTAPSSGTTFTVYGKAMDKDDAESVIVSKVIDLSDNTMPTATDESVTTPVDTPVDIDLTGTDVDDDDTTFTIVGNPSNGTIVAGTRSCDNASPTVCTLPYTYTPDSGYEGTDTFTYEVNDGILDSTVKTVTITIGDGGDGDTNVFRVGGEDRIETATFVSRLEFPTGSDVVFVATSWDYADALSTGPNSSLEPGPILLTPIAELAAKTATELTRLAPARIIVVGGYAAVSDAVFAQLDPYASESVTRIAGVDRFGTAAALSQELFPSGADTVYVATGRSYPDALAGGLAAGSEASPVLLTEQAALPASTRAELDRLNPTRIVIVGGTGAVSEAVAAELAGLAGTVDRISGADRFATTAEVVQEVVPGTDTVFVVTGRNFADALTGIPVAAMTGSAVLMVDTGALHAAVITELQRLQPRHILILGGTAAVSSIVAVQLGDYIGAGTGDGQRGLQLTQAQIDAATS